MTRRTRHAGSGGTFATVQLIIRNMVCERCKTAVQRVLVRQGLNAERILLGEVRLATDPGAIALESLRDHLAQEGFELVNDPSIALVTRIKAAVVDLVHHRGPSAERVKLSAHLSTVLHKEYSSLSALFSRVEGITIEHYFLLQRIERVKELVKYGEHTLSEIADHMGFSSVAHLSAQFKKLTGMTPTAFRTAGPRTPLDRVG